MADEAIKASQAAGAFQSAMGGGQVHFPVGKAEECAQHCDEFTTEIAAILDTLGAARAIAGMGGLDSGVQLQKGFHDKAQAASDFLKSYQSSVQSLADSFRAAEAGYVGVDADAAGVTRAHTSELGR